VQSVFTGAHEGFDLQVLFQSLEEVLDAPTVLIDGGYGIGSELEMVGESGRVGPSYLIDIQRLSSQKCVFSGLRTSFSWPKMPF